MYSLFVLGFSSFMIYRVVPKYGNKTPVVNISICSLVGSITVMASKGFGIALKLTFAGSNQLTHASTYFFAIMVGVCIVVQMNYFNKALDMFSTNVYVTMSFYWTRSLRVSGRKRRRANWKGLTNPPLFFVVVVFFLFV